MKLKVSDYIADFLHIQGTKHVFEMAGGMIAHLLDSLYQRRSTTIVSVHHEQSAAFAVDAYGRLTGRPSVALATSGPGATNLLTGMGSCYFDSAPALFITGQVNTHEQKGNRKIRQLGFQETDIVAMATPIAKKCFTISSPDEVVRVFEEAYTLAISDRSGPVLIDIPMDIQRAEIEIELPQKIFPISKKILSQDQEHITLLLQVLRNAKKPLILVGGGVTSIPAKQVFLEVLESIQIPVVTSLLGLSALEYNHPLRVGFIGSYGNRWANIALAECDCLLVLGSRLDIRQTGADVISFSRNKTIFHVDCDEAEINNRIKNCLPIVTDVAIFLKELLLSFACQPKYNFKNWLCYLVALKNQWSDIKELKNIIGINPNKFMHQLSSCSKAAVGFVADVGSHQMWAAQSLELERNQFFITSGGMGAMGFSLPAAIGASLAMNKKPVVIIVGDGSLQVNIQELQTIVRNNIPLKIVVINNQSLGMITQFQDSYFEGRYQSTYWGYDAPDFSKVAAAYGILAKRISTGNEISGGMKLLWEDPLKPALLEVMVQPHLPVYPKIAFGRHLSEMEPFAKPVAMEAT